VSRHDESCRKSLHPLEFIGIRSFDRKVENQPYIERLRDTFYKSWDSGDSSEDGEDQDDEKDGTNGEVQERVGREASTL